MKHLIASFFVLLIINQYSHANSFDTLSEQVKQQLNIEIACGGNLKKTACEKKLRELLPYKNVLIKARDQVPIPRIVISTINSTNTLPRGITLSYYEPIEKLVSFIEAQQKIENPSCTFSIENDAWWCNRGGGFSDNVCFCPNNRVSHEQTPYVVTNIDAYVADPNQRFTDANPAKVHWIPELKDYSFYYPGQDPSVSTESSSPTI